MPSQTTCKGCLQTFKSGAGLLSHLRQATNVRCKKVFKSTQEDAPGIDDHLDKMVAGLYGGDIVNMDEDFDLEPQVFGGDFFGNDYGAEDWPGWGGVEAEGHNNEEAEDGSREDNGSEHSLSESDSGSEWDNEPRWEPAASVHEGSPGVDANMSEPGTEDGFELPNGREAAENSLRQQIFIDQFPIASAGESLGPPEHHQHPFGDQDEGLPDNPYAPFASRLDWELARWAKLRGPGSTAVSELFGITGIQDALGLSYKNSRELDRIIDKRLPGRRPSFQRAEVIVEGEAYDVYYRDVLACVRALYNDESFAPYLVFVPERHYSDANRLNRLYHDMYTGKWWWSTQEKLEAEKPGATVVPIVLSSDKTQVTLLGGKSVYPVYLTIGNIPKEIRRKPSRQAHILLAYLPTTRVDHVTNAAARRRIISNIYHTALRQILQPLVAPGRHGILMASGDGVIRRTHPILAAHVGDYLEHIAAVGCKMGECPRCNVPHGELGNFDTQYPLRNLGEVLDALAKLDTAPLEFSEACRAAGIKPISHPYWEDLPYCNIYKAVPPDILHQLYQGLIKHLILWIKSAFDKAELDARCRRLPPNHHLRYFWKGITPLSRLTGKEHSDIARILLGLIIDMKLPGGQSTTRLVKATRALLDFLYLAQYPVHSSETLALLQDSLQRFHDNKQIFVDLGIRDGWELPKLHFAGHYVALIRWIGTTDNVNTEYTERLHIDFAKDAYEATNHKDELPQMTLWLERREKILHHEKYIGWRLKGRPRISVAIPLHPIPPARITMTKHPTHKSVPLDVISTDYQAPFIRDALARFIVHHSDSTLTSAQVEAQASDLDLPFRSLPVYHKAKFWLGDNEHHRLLADEFDVVHVRPSRSNQRGKTIPARFDTVLVNGGVGQYVGVAGYRVAQLKVIFSIPERIASKLFPPHIRPPRYLAYVEWFTQFDPAPRQPHLLYRIKRSLRNGQRLASVIPLHNIRRSCHLFPSFGAVAPRDWSTSNVLDLCPVFFVNSFSDRHAYHTII